MAPVLEKQLPGAAGVGDNNNEEEEGQNLWQVAATLLTTSRPPRVFLEKHRHYGSALSLPVASHKTPARLAVTLALTEAGRSVS